jgi:hypothetical protein
LYQNLVDATLRFLIERVGGVEGVYTDAGTLPRRSMWRGSEESGTLFG